MKNSRLIAVFLAATLMISCAPVQAVEQKSRLSKVKKQLNESLDRFKRCIRGKCTRKEKIKVARDVGIAAAAVLAMVGGGYLAWTVASKKHSVLPQRTITDEEFSRRVDFAKLPFFHALWAAQDDLRRAFTQRDDDALAMLWILRSFGPGRAIKDGFTTAILPDSPLLEAADRIHYNLAKNVLKLAVSGESWADLIRMIMAEKGTDPFFQIAYLFAQSERFWRYLPHLTVDEASRKTQQILQRVNDPLQITRLKNNITRLFSRHDWYRWQDFTTEITDNTKAIIKELDQWVKTH